MTSVILSAEERRAVMWSVLISVIVALAAYDYSLRNKQLAIGEQIVAARERQAAHSRKLQADQAIFQSIRDVDAAAFATDHRVRQLLRQCRSREEFLVREGGRIAWSELQASSATEQKLGLYVPAGRHWLRWQTDRDEVRIPLRNSYFLAIPQRLTANGSCLLPQGGQVYEIRIALDADRKKAELTVLGDGNEVIARSVLGQFSDPCEVSLLVKHHAFAYPAQIQAGDAGSLNFERRPTIPSLVMGLIDFNASGRSRRQALLWIDSEATPCVSAIEFVAHPRSFGQMNWHRANLFAGTKLSQLHVEEAIFEPYDDSDRLYFRSGLFGR